MFVVAILPTTYLFLPHLLTISFHFFYFLHSFLLQHILQRLAFKYYGDTDFKEFAFLSTSAVGKRPELAKHLNALPDGMLHDIARRVRLLPPPAPASSSLSSSSSSGAKASSSSSSSSSSNYGRAFLLEVLLNHFAERDSRVAQISQMSLYPDETLLWGDLTPGPAAASAAATNKASAASSSSSSSSSSLGSSSAVVAWQRRARPMALPKLNLQFLTFHDYLLRAFQLFRLEAAYEIRRDLTDAVQRVQPRMDFGTGETAFGGWARMATKVEGLSVTDVAKPSLGETVPAHVTADVTVSLAAFKAGAIRDEWEQLREHDVLFLVSVHPPAQSVSLNGGGKGGGGEGGGGGGGGGGTGYF